MKILMINSYGYLLGGIERVVFETTKILETKGHEVIPFAMKDLRNQPNIYSKYYVDQRDISQVKYSLEGLITASKIIYNNQARTNIKRLINDVKPDIAHVHHMYGRLTPSILHVLKDNHIPTVMTAHDYRLVCPNNKLFDKGVVCEKCNTGWWGNILINRCVKDSIAASMVYALEFYIYKFAKTFDKCINAFIAPSTFMKDKLVEFGFDSSKVFHLYNSLNLDDYCPSYTKQDYCLYFGRLSPEKGLDVLVEAMQMNTHRKLMIVGVGELEQSLKDKAKSFKLDIEFCGFKSGDALKQVVRNARCVIVPSIWYENNPMVVLEAFALGTPVIGADIGGISELICNGDNGYLFKAGSPSELAKYIRIIFESDDDRVAIMGKKARQFVEERFSCEKHYEILLNIYRHAIEIANQRDAHSSKLEYS